MPLSLLYTKEQNQRELALANDTQPYGTFIKSNCLKKIKHSIFDYNE